MQLTRIAKQRFNVGLGGVVLSGFLLLTPTFKKRFKFLHHYPEMIRIFTSSNNKEMTQVALIKSKNGTSEELVRFSQYVEQLEKWVAKVNEENKAFGISQYFRIAYNEQDKFFTGAAQ